MDILGLTTKLSVSDFIILIPIVSTFIILTMNVIIVYILLYKTKTRDSIKVIYHY